MRSLPTTVGQDAETANGSPISGEVMAAAMLLIGAVVPTLAVVPHDRIAVDPTLTLLGWVPLGLAGIVLLDQRPGSWLGRTCVLASITPALVVATALWLTKAAATGTAAVGLNRLSGPWLLAPLLAVAAVAWCTAQDRSDRRWACWILMWTGAGGLAVLLVWQQDSPAWQGGTAAFSQLAVAASVVIMAVGAPPRPVVEPLVDAALIIMTLAVALGTGLVIRWFAVSQVIFGADAIGLLAAGAAFLAAGSAALWLRREFLAARYGTGMIAPEAVAAITADLGPTSEARQLLGQAAELVSLGTGVEQVHILLDAPQNLDSEPGRVAVPLNVADQTVGTMLLQLKDGGALETRQQRAVAQLTPTVALMTRAVTLALAAQDAQRDLNRLREVERARILSDLHDDLGPVLAGMSMRVAAARVSQPSTAWDALAADLTTCRADLRRIVGGLQPPALADGDVAGAIADLIASYDQAPITVWLAGSVPDRIDPEAAIVVYRTIAEGVTNALRHGGAQDVRICLERSAGRLCIEIADDGVTAGPIVPGVGLSSLRQRAADLSGSLEVTSTPGDRTKLRVQLPEMERGAEE